MNELRRLLADLAVGFTAALLPSPERERLAGPRGVPVAGFSLALGLVELAGGILGFTGGGLAFMRYGTLETSLLLLENWWPGMTSIHVAGAGMVNALAWLLHPVAWVTAAIALVGGARCVAWAAAHEAVPEPVVWAVVRVWQAVRRRIDLRRREQRFGPPRPDRIVEGPGGALVLLTRTERPEWNERVTIEVRGRHYRLTGVGERRDGAWSVLAYRMREQAPEELIRRLVRYEPD